MKVTTHLIEAETMKAAATKAMRDTFNADTHALIKETVKLLTETGATLVFQATWAKSGLDFIPDYTITAYVQVYDTDLNLYQVMIGK